MLSSCWFAGETCEDCGSATFLSCTGENVSIPSGSPSELFSGLGSSGVLGDLLLFKTRFAFLQILSCHT